MKVVNLGSVIKKCSTFFTAGSRYGKRCPWSCSSSDTNKTLSKVEVTFFGVIFAFKEMLQMAGMGFFFAASLCFT